MTARSLISIIFFLGVFGNSFSQNIQTANLKYTPSDNGFELNIPFKWKFIDCYGEVHVTITKNSKKITSNAYIFNGKRYTKADLGSDAFIKPDCGLTDIMVDLYDGSFRLGEGKLGNVIDWFGGCFGQTYHITKIIGLNDADYKEKLSSLSLKNIRFLQVSSRDYKIEGKINDLEKAKSLKSKLQEADNAYNSGDFEQAKSLYEEALKINYDNDHAKSRIADIKKKLKENKETAAFEKLMESADELFSAGDYEAAKAAYEKALRIKPDNSGAQGKLDEINEKLKAEQERKDAERAEAENNAAEENSIRKEKEEAATAAANRRHSGLFWGQDYQGNRSQAGSSFQETNLIGLFKVEYDLWSLSGEVAHRFKFYWEWDDALNTGYPQYASVLKQTIIQIADFKKYPNLLERWNNIKPLYVEIECEILSFKKGDEFVATTGKIKIIPEAIGKSGDNIDWSLPGSPKWNELLTYTNNMQWDYFRKIGVYKEIDEYADEYSTDIAWPKYAFEYSDNINFYQGDKYFSSEFTTLSDLDYKNYSTSASLSKVVWPEEQMMALIEEFKMLEKRSSEEKMEATDFWNSTENDKKTKSTNFWDTPDNTKTTQDVKKEQILNQNLTAINNRSPIISNQRKKYEMLKNPFKILSHKSRSTVEEGRITLKGNLHPYLSNTGKVSVSIEGENFRTSTSSGNFSSEIILSEGWNDIQLEILCDGFGFSDNVEIFYKKPPPLPCDELTKSGSGKAINEHGVGKETGAFYVEWDFYSAYDEMIIYAGPKERKNSGNIIFEKNGKGVGRKKVYFTDIVGGVVTVEFNKGISGSSWEYLIKCPE